MLWSWLVGLLLLTQPMPASGSAAELREPVDVALDPGHSRVDVGAVGGGLREYELTLELAQRVRARLELAHLTVRMTRQDDLPLSDYTDPNATPQIQAEQEARIAAGGPARIYVSLHFNGGPANLRGTETYYNPERAPEAATADHSLAALLQAHVVAALADDVGYPAVDRGAKSDLLAGKSYGHFFSLRGPYPSALVENLFLSNANDAAALRDEATLDALADGYVQGVLEYFAAEAAARAAVD